MYGDIYRWLVEEGTRNGGAGHVASCKNQKWVERKATGEWCSSSKDKMIAMLEAVKQIRKIKPKETNIWSESSKNCMRYIVWKILRVFKYLQHIFKKIFSKWQKIFNTAALLSAQVYTCLLVQSVKRLSLPRLYSTCCHVELWSYNSWLATALTTHIKLFFVKSNS